MNLSKKIFTSLSSLLSDGLFIKLRHAFPDFQKIYRSFKKFKRTEVNFRLTDRIVVVGIGTAALSCLRELKKEGFCSVTIVAKDLLFGGKCVNFGCMPIEFALTMIESGAVTNRDSLANFISNLREDAQHQFDALEYPISVGIVDKVCGNGIYLTDTRKIEFDRLIVAIGNTYPLPILLQDIPNVIFIEDFWTIPLGSRIVIFAENNIAALTLGEVALRLGLIPTVLVAGNNPISKMPSFRYFVRGIGKQGVTIYEKVRLNYANANEILFDSNGKAVTLSYDYLMVFSRPIPNFFEIDGKLPNLFDIDLVSGSLPTRPDIVFLGDGGGLMTASEADIHAKLIMRSWKLGERIDFRILDLMPISLHATQSLAMVGSEWTYTATRWMELDFRALGWSKVHNLEGKIWFILDLDSGKVESLHICHKHASELICLGTALMNYPVWDNKWMCTSIHPSSSEIFKVLAEQAISVLPYRPSAYFDTPDAILEFSLPPLDQFHSNSELPSWVTKAQWQTAVLTKEPRATLAVFFGLSKLSMIINIKFPIIPSCIKGNKFELEDGQTISIENLTDTKICRLSYGTKVVTVFYRAEP